MASGILIPPAQGARTVCTVCRRRSLLIKFLLAACNVRARVCVFGNSLGRSSHAAPFCFAAGAAPEETNQRSSSAHNRHSLTKGKFGALQIAFTHFRWPRRKRAISTALNPIERNKSPCNHPTINATESNAINDTLDVINAPLSANIDDNTHFPRTSSREERRDIYRYSLISRNYTARNCIGGKSNLTDQSS